MKPITKSDWEAFRQVQKDGLYNMSSPDAVATYDIIKGAEQLGQIKAVRKGLDWFIKHYTKEYMILLD